MRRLRSIGDGAAGAFGAFLGLAFVALQFALFVGGLAYKKECVTDEGTVKSEWTFQWAAPIPYVFRPSEPGCVVHTGTRVALHSVGIGKYEETTPSLVAEKYAENTTDTDSAYYVRIREGTKEYIKRNEDAQTITEGEQSIDAYLNLLGELAPPQRFAEAHAELVAALEKSKSLTGQVRSAVEGNDRSAMRKLQPVIERSSADVAEALQEIERLRAAG